MLSLIKQIKQRRLSMSLKQSDMEQRAGMSRQQYQRLESRGNPRLETLELIAKGLKSELMLVPQDKLAEVQAILAENPSEAIPSADDPWEGLL